MPEGIKIIMSGGDFIQRLPPCFLAGTDFLTEAAPNSVPRYQQPVVACRNLKAYRSHRMSGRIQRFHRKALSFPGVAFRNQPIHMTGHGLRSVQKRSGGFYGIPRFHLLPIQGMEEQPAAEFLLPEMRRPHMVVVSMRSQNKFYLRRLHAGLSDIFFHLLIPFRRTAVYEEPSVLPLQQSNRGIKEMGQAGAANLVYIR